MASVSFWLTTNEKKYLETFIVKHTMMLPRATLTPLASSGLQSSTHHHRKQTTSYASDRVSHKISVQQKAATTSCGFRLEIIHSGGRWSRLQHSILWGTVATGRDGLGSTPTPAYVRQRQGKGEVEGGIARRRGGNLLGMVGKQGGFDHVSKSMEVRVTPIEGSFSSQYMTALPTCSPGRLICLPMLPEEGQ